MHVRRIDTLEEWEQFAQPWNCLAGGAPFCSWEWLFSWRRHFSGGELYILAVFDETRRQGEPGALVGAAPLLSESSGPRGKVLRFLGSGIVCSDYMSLLSTAEHQHAVADAIAKWLTQAAQSGPSNGTDNRWDLLEMTGVAAASPLIRRFGQCLSSYGNSVHRRAGLNCWRIDLPSSWDEYLAQLSKSHRKQVRRSITRVLDAGDAVLHTIDGRTAENRAKLKNGMKVLVDLHQRRRTRLGESGLFADKTFSAFLHEAAERLLEAGRLQLHWLELRGRPAAAEFHLLGGDVVYAYQAGVEPDMLDDEPGRLMNIAVLRTAIADGRRGFDFLRGDEPYKAHWRAAPVECIEMRVVPRRAAARLRHGVWAAAQEVPRAVKHWLKDNVKVR